MYRVGGYVVVCYQSRLGCTADEKGFKAQLLQSVVDGFGSSASAKYEGFFVGVCFKHGLYALRKTYDVAVVTPQCRVVSFVADSDNVYCPYGCCLFT